VHCHVRTVAQVVVNLSSTLAGLTSDEVEKRLQQHGLNELTEKAKKTPPMMFLDQFRDFMLLILVAAALSSGFIGELSDTIAIIVIAASELVPGDIVILEAGNAVPTDMQLIESAHLQVEEAALTGESVQVEKHTASLHDEHLPVGDRKNMVYNGTFVTYVRGRGVIATTGLGHHDRPQPLADHGLYDPLPYAAWACACDQIGEAVALFDGLLL